MKKLLGITRDHDRSLGGFVELGQIVFTTQAGALFEYKLLWAVALGTIAIIVYMEMCGRIAVVAREPSRLSEGVLGSNLVWQRWSSRMCFT
jgi:Mn2+/Fe2+ NRAMP family transporter